MDGWWGEDYSRTNTGMATSPERTPKDIEESGAYRKNAPGRRIREEGIGEMTRVQTYLTESAKEMS